MSHYSLLAARDRSRKSAKNDHTRPRRSAAAGRVTEPLESRVLLSTTTIDHSAVSATVGGFPAGGTDLTLNGSLADPTMMAPGGSIGATTTNMPAISNVLQLTDANNSEAFSAFDKTVQGVDTFHTTFDFTFGTNPPNADGMTFVLQNDPAKDTAIQGGGSNMAYGGMANSVAVKFDLWDNDEQPNGGPIYTATGVYINGDPPFDTPHIDASSTPVVISTGTEPTVDLSKKPDGTPTGMDFHNNLNDVYHVDLNYDGTTLTETVTDQTKNVTVTQAYIVDIPNVVGGHTAYAGFTGATGGANAEQDIIDWKYTGTAGSGGLPLPTPHLGAGSDCNAGSALLYFNDGGAANVTGFEIDMATGGGAFSKLADVAGTAKSYTASGLDPTMTYQFEVKALGDGKASTDSGFSNVESVTPAGSQAIDFSGGFPSGAGLQFNGTTDLTGPAPNPPPNITIPSNALELTPDTINRAGSVYATSEQMISKFDTSFDFVYPESTSATAEGFTFIVQKDPSGLVALGDNSGGLGYFSTTTPITKSVVIKFDINDGANNDSTGLFTNGHDPRAPATPPDQSVDMTPSGVVLATTNTVGTNIVSDKYHVHLTYDGTTLHEEVDDKTTGKTFTHDYTVDIPTIIGDTCGWVGFTASTGGSTTEQVVTSWTFTGASTGGGPKDVINDPTGGGAITLKQDGTNHAQIDWTLGAQSGNLPITDAKGLTINNMGAAADTITLDSSNGDPLPNSLKLNGGFAVNGLAATTIGAGQTVDIQSSHVKVNYSGTSLLSAIQAYLKGGKIISSTLASDKLAVADVDNGSAILLQPAIKGDVNLDGKVDFGDFVALARNYGKTSADWSMGDFDYDAKVDFGDLVALARNYGGTGPTAAMLTPAVSSDTATLPKSRRPLSTRL